MFHGEGRELSNIFGGGLSPRNPCLVPLLVLVYFLSSSFLFIALSHENLRLRPLPGNNKRDRIETLTQCTELGEFVVDYFGQSETNFTGVFRSSNISRNSERTCML